MKHASLFLTLALAAVRCSSPATSPADAGAGDAGACLVGTALPPHATLCEPDAGPPCCAPARCSLVPGGFACLAE